MLNLNPNLLLSRCPHCSVATPNLDKVDYLETKDHAGKNKRIWAIYVCKRCGGVVSAYANNDQGPVLGYFPATRTIADDLPERPRTYLQQALESLHAPAGAVMLAASAVDSMLKEKGLVSGSLYSRIDQAEKDGIITTDMAKWAHEVRLDANDQQHFLLKRRLPEHWTSQWHWESSCLSCLTE